jgi:hypothetical protein
MVSIASAVSQLETRRKALEVELAAVTSKLKAIQQTLEVAEHSQSRDSSKETRAAEAAPGAALKSNGGKGPARRKARKLRQWFASGEAVGMMKRLVRSPLTASEIVKLLAHAKGYDKSLPPDQLKRFHGTAYMAVSNAVKAGAATKLKDGRVRIR